MPSMTPDGPQELSVGTEGHHGSDEPPSLDVSRSLSFETHQDLLTKPSAGDVSDQEEIGGTQSQVSWKVAAGPHDMTALDVIILWLTTGDNYDKWRRGSCSKKDVGEMVSTFLAQNGHPGRSSAMCQYQVTYHSSSAFNPV